jgi:O-antigen/teichoic acid export membrane protein
MKNAYEVSANHLKHDIKKRAVRGSGITIFSAGLSFSIQIVSTMVLARLLAPSDFGLITMVTTFSLLLQNFGFNGFTEALIQRSDIDQEIVSTVFWINLGSCFSLTFLFMLSGPILAKFFKEPRLVNITAVVAFSIIASGFSTIHLALLKRKMQFALASFIVVGARLVAVTVAIVLASMGFGYWALAASTVTIPLAQSIGAWAFCGWRPGKPAKRQEVRTIVKFALHTYGNFALNYCCRNLDNLLVGKFLGLQPLGFYKKAYDLFALSANQLTAPLANVALAALSKFSNEAQKFRQYYLNSISVIAFISMGISLVLTMAAKDIILLMLGPQWAPAAEIFRFFGPGVGLLLIYSTHGWLHLSLGRADRWFRWAILEFVVTASLFVVGIFFGSSGVALAWTISFFLLTIPALWYGGRPVNLSVSSIISVIWKHMAAAVAAGACAWYLLSVNGWASNIFSSLRIIPRLAVTASLTTLFYLIITIMVHGNLKPITNLVSLLRMMAPKRRTVRS